MTNINHQSNNFYLVADFFFVLSIHLVYTFLIKCFYLTCSNMSFMLSNKFLNDTSINLSFTMPSFESLIDHALFVQSDPQFFILPAIFATRNSEYSMPILLFG